MTVLIFTRSDDNDSVQTVMKAIEQRGGPRCRAFRFNTDQYPTDVKLSIRTGDDSGAPGGPPSGFQLETEDGSLAQSDVTAVWYRRFHAGARIPEALGHQFRQASLLETRTTLMGLLNSLEVFIVDPLPLIHRAKNKQLQLELARKAGLLTPRTLISNDPDEVRAFADECDGAIVTKMMSSFAIYDEQQRENVVFTNPVSESDLKDMDGLRFCPMTFQECVPKSLELRATIVGNRVFTACIDSQASGRAKHDWRRDGEQLVEHWQKFELPPDVEAGLLRLMDALGLNYGAADFVLRPDGGHVFLEVNPSGEFFWLDRWPGLPISEAIADILVDPTHRRSVGDHQLSVNH